MARHFAPRAPPSTPVYQSLSHWTWFDWLHFFSRLLFTLLFLYTIIRSLSDIEVTVSRLIALGVPSDLSYPLVFTALIVAFIGCAFFVTGSDPLSLFFLLAYLIPTTVIDQALPLYLMKRGWDDPTVHAALMDLLRNLSLIASMIIVWGYTQQMEYLEGERKVEIKKALQEWYDKQERKEGGGEERKEPKKVK